MVSCQFDQLFFSKVTIISIEGCLLLPNDRLTLEEASHITTRKVKLVSLLELNTMSARFLVIRSKAFT